jgi:hypothetical protein
MTSFKVSFIAFLLMFSGFAFGQSNFLPGYYVTLDGDTIRGYIDYRNQIRNELVCTYKDPVDATTQILRPEKIKAFSINDIDYYESHALTTRKGVQITGFFRVIVRGRISLLSHRKEYYAKDSSARLYDLSRKPTTVDRVVHQDFYSVGALKFLMQDCPDLLPRIEQQYKSSTGLPQLFEDYYKCVTEPYFRTRIVKIEPRIRVGISLSATSTRLVFNKPGFNFNDKIIPEGGVYVSLFVPRISERFRLMGEVLYGQTETYAYSRSTNFASDYFAKYSSLRIPIYARYSLSTFFIEAGIQNQLMLNQQLRWRMESIQDGVVLTNEVKTTRLPTDLVGLIAGMGLNLKVGNISIQPAARINWLTYLKNDNEPRITNVEFNVKVGTR